VARLARARPTAKQLRLLREVHRWTRRHVYPPTLAELADRLGIRSGRYLHTTITRLCERGYLARTYATSRSLVVTRRGRVALREARAEGE